MRLRWEWLLVARRLSGQVQRHPRIDGGVAAGVVAATAIAYLVVRSRRPSADELERRRRERIAQMGRITDGLLVDVRTFDGEDSTAEEPEVMFYSYRLAGVTYNCAQDVSKLAAQVRGYRLDQPVQVRYDARNPGNSIIAAANWSGVLSLPGAALFARAAAAERQPSSS